MPLCVLTSVKRLHSRGSRHDTLAASSQPSVVYLGGHQMLLQTSASLVVTGSTQYALWRAPRYFGLCQTNSTPIGHASFHWGRGSWAILVKTKVSYPSNLTRQLGNTRHCDKNPRQIRNQSKVLGEFFTNGSKVLEEWFFTTVYTVWKQQNIGISNALFNKVQADTHILSRWCIGLQITCYFTIKKIQWERNCFVISNNSLYMYVHYCFNCNTNLFVITDNSL